MAKGDKTNSREIKHKIELKRKVNTTSPNGEERRQRQNVEREERYYSRLENEEKMRSGHAKVCNSEKEKETKEKESKTSKKSKLWCEKIGQLLTNLEKSINEYERSKKQLL